MSKKSFVSVQHNNFSKKIPPKFIRYKMPEPPKTIKSGCVVKHNSKDKTKLFKYQRFIGSYVGPKTPYSCLIWHSVGSGKTMTMWKIISEYIRVWHTPISLKRIFVISNPKQLEGFQNELNLFSKATGIKRFLSPKFSKSVKFGDKLSRARLGIRSQYGRQQTDILLMNFVEASKYARGVGFHKCVVILDEAHNLVNPPDTYKRFSDELLYLRDHLSRCVSNQETKVIPLTATPVKQHIGELGSLLNMVSKNIKFPTTEKGFIQKYNNKSAQLKKDTKGLISYFNRESDLSVQPRKETGNTQFGELNIELGSHQLQAMKRTIRANKTYDHQNVGLLRTQATFSGMGNSAVRNHCNKLDEHLHACGQKLRVILAQITDPQKAHDKHWIYCGHTRRSGVAPMSESLECMGWGTVNAQSCSDIAKLQKTMEQLVSNSKVTALPGDDYKRYIVLESCTPQKVSALVLQILNHYQNVAGKLFRVVIGDRSRKEGMDLFSIKHVHILSPETKYSDWHQAISRAIRFCSFRFVPNVKDWVVNIFTYVSMNAPRVKNRSEFFNIDKLNLNKAVTSYNKIEPYMKALKEAAVDCQINNGMHKIEGLHCAMTRATSPMQIVGQTKQTSSNNIIPSPHFTKSKTQKTQRSSSKSKTQKTQGSSSKSKTQRTKSSSSKSKITGTIRSSQASTQMYTQNGKSNGKTYVGKLKNNPTNIVRVKNGEWYNPFLGKVNKGSKKVHISELLNLGYNDGYHYLNYNKAYKRGSALKKTPKLSAGPRNSQVSNKFKLGQLHGIRNAKHNAMMNGFRNKKANM